MVSDKILAEKISYKTGRGYWEINGKYFFNKAECLKYATENKIFNSIKYNFFDSVYKSLDWTKEPTETLNELYLKRALQLRDKYDYLILCFSGGSDSTNILNTFLKNNIRLDEIYTVYPVSVIEKLLPQFDKNDNNEYNLIFEYVEAALPKLKEVSVTHPNIKITIDDSSTRSIQFVESTSVDKLFFSGYMTSPTLSGQYMLAERLRSLADKKKVAAICGLDKPRIIYDFNVKRFGAIFHDFNNFWGNVNINGFEAITECFYLTPDMPTITQKQSFQIKRKLLELANINGVASLLSLGFVKNSSLIFDAHDEFFKRALYEDWNSSVWQAKKTTSFFYMRQSNWFHRTNLTDSRIKDYYDGQVKELLHGISSSLIEYKDEKPSMLKNFYTSPIWF